MHYFVVGVRNQWIIEHAYHFLYENLMGITKEKHGLE